MFHSIKKSVNTKAAPSARRHDPAITQAIASSQDLHRLMKQLDAALRVDALDGMKKWTSANQMTIGTLTQLVQRSKPDARTQESISQVGLVATQAQEALTAYETARLEAASDPNYESYYKDALAVISWAVQKLKAVETRVKERESLLTEVEYYDDKLRKLRMATKKKDQEEAILRNEEKQTSFGAKLDACEADIQKGNSKVVSVIHLILGCTLRAFATGMVKFQSLPPTFVEVSRAVHDPRIATADAASIERIATELISGGNPTLPSSGSVHSNSASYPPPHLDPVVAPTYDPLDPSVQTVSSTGSFAANSVGAQVHVQGVPPPAYFYPPPQYPVHPPAPQQYQYQYPPPPYYPPYYAPAQPNGAGPSQSAVPRNEAPLQYAVPQNEPEENAGAKKVADEA
uniref:BAR domain-containing protein n=1 Tax=Timspurckia oligopyrenoides TaxID=708627 RepID=A0A7S0ZDW9_9RHOD|mmetsp:Transcript_143/g.249  ORF Transcript_143/g.249 Transcript_143/m.249 type:complete len:401 (+) Transcript_143:64-1266(+)